MTTKELWDTLYISSYCNQKIHATRGFLFFLFSRALLPFTLLRMAGQDDWRITLMISELEKGASASASAVSARAGSTGDVVARFPASVLAASRDRHSRALFADGDTDGTV